MAVEDAPVAAGSKLGALGKKVGPLPLWGWLVGLGIGGAAAVALRRRGSGGGGGGAGPSGAGVGGPGGVSGAVGMAQGAAPWTTVERPDFGSNEEWWQAATEALVADGVGGTKASSEMTTFLSGGVATADTQRLADRAIALVGPPPFPPPPLQQPPTTTPQPGKDVRLGEREFLVGPGWSLTDVSQHFYGTPEDWGGIYVRNQAAIDAVPGNTPGYDGKHNILAGMILTIPAVGNTSGKPIQSSYGLNF